MHTTSAFVFSLVVWLEANLCVHADAMDIGSSLDEWKVERVTVVRGDDCRLGIADVLEPASDECRLVISLKYVLEHSLHLAR